MTMEGSEKIIVSDKSGKSTLVFDSAKGPDHHFSGQDPILSAKGDLTISIASASPSTAAPRSAAVAADERRISGNRLAL